MSAASRAVLGRYEQDILPVARLGEELVAAGIPRHDIVLGFYPAELRPLTSYGVG